MNSRPSLLLALTLIGGCASPPPPAPPVTLQEAERGMLVGNNAMQQDDYATAALQFHQALVAYATLDQPRGMVAARINLAQTALATGNLDATEEQLTAARYTLEREGLTEFTPRLQLMEAEVASRHGRSEVAARLLEGVLEPPSADTCNDPLHLAALSDRTGIALATNDGGAARWIERLAGALEGCGEGGPPHLHRELALYRGRLERFRAALASRTGTTAAALQAYATALEHYRQALYRPGLAATLYEWGRLLAEQGDRQGAWDRLQRALTIRLRLQDRLGTEEVIRLLIGIEDGLGHPAQASELRAWLKRLGEEGFDDWPRLKEQRSSVTLPYR